MCGMNQMECLLWAAARASSIAHNVYFEIDFISRVREAFTGYQVFPRAIVHIGALLLPARVQGVHGGFTRLRRHLHPALFLCFSCGRSRPAAFPSSSTRTHQQRG